MYFPSAEIQFFENQSVSYLATRSPLWSKIILYDNSVQDSFSKGVNSQLIKNPGLQKTIYLLITILLHVLAYLLNGALIIETSKVK